MRKELQQIATGQQAAAATLRPALALLLLLNAVSLGLVIRDTRATLARAYDRARRGRLTSFSLGEASSRPCASWRSRDRYRWPAPSCLSCWGPCSFALRSFGYLTCWGRPLFAGADAGSLLRGGLEPPHT